MSTFPNFKANIIGWWMWPVLWLLKTTVTYDSGVTIYTKRWRGKLYIVKATVSDDYDGPKPRLGE